MGPLIQGLHLKHILAKYLNFKNNLLVHYKHQGRKTTSYKEYKNWLASDFSFTTLRVAAFRGF